MYQKKSKKKDAIRYCGWGACGQLGNRCRRKDPVEMPGGHEILQGIDDNNARSGEDQCSNYGPRNIRVDGQTAAEPAEYCFVEDAFFGKPKRRGVFHAGFQRSSPAVGRNARDRDDLRDWRRDGLSTGDKSSKMRQNIFKHDTQDMRFVESGPVFSGD